MVANMRLITLVTLRRTLMSMVKYFMRLMFDGLHVWIHIMLIDQLVGIGCERLYESLKKIPDEIWDSENTIRKVNGKKAMAHQVPNVAVGNAVPQYNVYPAVAQQPAVFFSKIYFTFFYNVSISAILLSSSSSTVS